MPENAGVLFSSVFLDKIPPIDPRVDEMIQWGKKFHESGIVQGVEGNLSFRTKLGFIITGSGINLENLTKDDVLEVRGVVYGLNRPSIYVKGKAASSLETLLHSGLYEALPEINAIFQTPAGSVLRAVDKLRLPSTVVEQPAGSQELAQEAVNFVKLNKGIRCFVLKNSGIITLGVTISEVGELMGEN